MRKRCPVCNKINDPKFKEIQGLIFTIKNVLYYSCDCGHEWMPYPSEFRINKINNNFKLPEFVTLVSELDVNVTQTDVLEFNDSRYGNFKTYFKALKDAGWVSVHPQAVIDRRMKTQEGMKDQMKEARKRTMIQRYGVEHQSQSKELLERQREAIRNNKEKTTLKTKETLMIKYGVENPMQIESAKQKHRDNVLRKYGVDNVAKVPEVKAKISHSMKETLSDKERYKNNEIYNVLPNGENLKHYAQQHGLKYFGMARWLYINVSPQKSQEYIESYKSTYSEINKSSLEKYTEKLLSDMNIKFFNQKSLGRFRPDFKVNDNLYIEVDGLQYHYFQEGSGKTRDLHFRKRQIFEQNNIEILQFRQNELYLKKDIVRNMIQYRKGLIKNKISAKKLKGANIDSEDRDMFFNLNDIQGSTEGECLGLIDEDGDIKCAFIYELTNNEVIIKRYCNKLNVKIYGGFTKLLNSLKTFNKNITMKIDLRFGYGEFLKKLGFEFIKDELNCEFTDKVYVYSEKYDENFNEIYGAGIRTFCLKIDK